MQNQMSEYTTFLGQNQAVIAKIRKQLDEMPPSWVLENEQLLRDTAGAQIQKSLQLPDRPLTDSEIEFGVKKSGKE